MKEKLDIDKKKVQNCRKASSEIADGIQGYIDVNTTTSVERTVVRLLGVDGVDEHDIPLANVVVDNVLEEGELNRGIAFWIGNAVLDRNKSPQEIAEEVAEKKISLTKLPLHDFEEISKSLEKYIFLIDFNAR